MKYYLVETKESSIEYIEFLLTSCKPLCSNDKLDKTLFDYSKRTLLKIKFDNKEYIVCPIIDIQKFTKLYKADDEHGIYEPPKFHEIEISI